MELIGEVAMNAPRERVWAALNDAAVLQACIPGCEQVSDESPDVRLVRVMVKMGPVRARFNGRITMSEVDAPQRCVMPATRNPLYPCLFHLVQVLVKHCQFHRG